MKLYTLLFALLLSNTLYAQEGEEEAVRAAFAGYKTAILSDQGDEAVEFVDKRTLDYYASILSKAKHGNFETLDTLSILDKLMVLSIRSQTSKSDLLSFDGKELFIYAIESGLVGKSSVSNNSIGEVEVAHHFASGRLISNGAETPISFHFYKEEGEWHVDLTSIFQISAEAFKQMQLQSGQDENAFLFALLEATTGSKPSQSLWEPLQ